MKTHIICPFRLVMSYEREFGDYTEVVASSLGKSAQVQGKRQNIVFTLP